MKSALIAEKLSLTVLLSLHVLAPKDKKRQDATLILLDTNHYLYHCVCVSPVQEKANRSRD